MSTDKTLDAYEALLARAVAFARGVGEMGPTRAEDDERWLARCVGGVRLHWVGDGPDERSLAVPSEAFTVDEPAFAAWVLLQRVEREERREPNAAAFTEMLNRVFKGRP